MARYHGVYCCYLSYSAGKVVVCSMSRCWYVGLIRFQPLCVLQFVVGLIINQSVFKRRFKKAMKDFMAWRRTVGKVTYVLFAGIACRVYVYMFMTPNFLLPRPLASVYLSTYSSWATIYIGFTSILVMRAVLILLAACVLFDVDIMYELM